MFINEGVYRKSAGPGRHSCQIDFLNQGTLGIDSGTINFVLDYTHSNAVIALNSGALSHLRREELRHRGLFHEGLG